MITFHGPLVTTLRKSAKTTCTALMDAISPSSAPALKARKVVVLNHGRASGPVVGGNLTIMTHLLGTPFEPRLKGHLVFLEDRGEAPYRIDRMLSQLRLAGLLDGVAGVILGAFDKCGPIEDVYAIAREAFNATDIPVQAGFELGHGTNNLTVPIGLEAQMES
jgi:muramoyltetrapeptide carboxypeptidase